MWEAFVKPLHLVTGIMVDLVIPRWGCWIQSFVCFNSLALLKFPKQIGL